MHVLKYKPTPIYTPPLSPPLLSPHTCDKSSKDGNSQSRSKESQLVSGLGPSMTTIPRLNAESTLCGIQIGGGGTSGEHQEETGAGERRL